MRPIDDLKRETAALVRAEHEHRLDRDARAHRDGPILDAFDGLVDGRLADSETAPASCHRARLRLVP